MHAPLPLLIQIPPEHTLEQLADMIATQLHYTETTPLFHHVDVHLLNWDQELQQPQPLQIAQVRTLTQESTLQPYQGIGATGLSVYIIFAIETASVPAQHALLKMLEEPPSFVQLVLTTQSFDAVLATIRSRCQELRLASGSPPQPPQPSNPSTTTSAASTTTQLTNIANSSLSQILDLAESYKEREDALKFVQQLITAVHERQQHAPQLAITTALTTLITAYNQLQHNSNVRLTLESCLLALKPLLHELER